MFNKVNPAQNFPRLEDKITKYWKKNKIFEKSVSNRDEKNKFIFYDGPPFITGSPHYGSLLPSIAKDVVPRYQTMKGHYVSRVWGWDCHGLPIETLVEKALNIKNRKDVETFGIQKFVDECYKYARETSADWKWYIDKIGRWVDFDNSYKTMDQDYMESVIWNFKNLYEKKMVYEGVRTSLYCTRCGTPVSNFEIAMDNSYIDMEDPAVTIKLPVLTEGKFKGDSILAWTTTPWTLPSNKALVLDPKEDYVIVAVQKLDIELERAWLVKELPENINKLKRSNITQAYLENYIDEDGQKPKHARLRKKDNEYTFTLKYFAGSNEETGQLVEKTEEISKERYVELIKQATKKVVKARYYFPLDDGLTAEIDSYQNQLLGLNVVEVEFSSLNKEKNFKKPDWFGKEVTDSNGVYPPVIADKPLEEVYKINDEYTQKLHNYSEHATVEKVILAKARVEAVLGNLDYEIIETFKGKELLGLKYQPPFNYFPASEKENKVYSYENMVSMEEGTGIVHSAPGFGDIDTDMGKHYGLNIAMSINEEGKYLDFITDYKGLYVKEADKYIMADLTKKNIMFKQEKIVHRYPFCYRCDTPLLQKAQPSWFLDIQNLKTKLLANNEKINWVPSNLKHGRFKKGIEMAPDWCISRTRYWATPMPIWQKTENGKVVERVVIGSRDELREKAVQPITKVVFVKHEDKEGDEVEAEYSNILGAGTEQRQKYIEIALRIKTKENVTRLSDASEEVLRAEFAPYLQNLRIELDNFLNKIKGKYILASIPQNIMAMIIHLVEGRNLKECFALSFDNRVLRTIYFNGTELLDLHRPKIDNITLKGKTGELTRIPEVLDVWMDSASMPYASKHYPFEDKKDFEDNFPADFVIEYIAQTRAWFYVMHVLGTALFDSRPFNNVVTTGVIFGTDGRKMSKSYGNYPDPRLVLEKYGAEPLRLYLMGAPIMVGEDINLEEVALKIQTRDFILPLWNCYSFFITYANMHNWKATQDFAHESSLEKVKDELDLWILLKLQQTIKKVTLSYDKYNLPAVVKEYKSFVNELSKWYIRRSRVKFNSNDTSALSTLYYVLVSFAKLLAPMCPFLSEELYQNLVRTQFSEALESVHLNNFPIFDKTFFNENETILPKMEFVRNVVELGQSVRASQGLRVRQALSTLEVQSKDVILDAWMKELIIEELNIKTVRIVKKLTEGGKWVIAKNEVSDGQKIEICLDTNLTTGLIQEGIYREIVRGIQNIRKKSGLVMGVPIIFVYKTSDVLVQKTINEQSKDLCADISAKSIKQSENDLQWDATIKINGVDLFFKLSIVEK